MKDQVIENKPGTVDNNYPRLLELEKKLALFMLNTEESFVLVDTSYRIVTFNHQFNHLYSKFFGKNVEKGQSILDYAQQHTLEGLKDIYNRVFSGEIVESELEIPVPGQPAITFLIRYKPAYDEDKSIMGAFVSGKDITDVRQARQDLLQSEDKYRSIIEHSHIAFFLTIPEDPGTILQVNKAAVEMFGYSFAEFEKLNWQLLLEKDGRHLVFGMHEGNKEGKTVGETVGIRKNGQRFHCEYSSVSFKDLNGESRTTSTIIDISDRKQAEEKLRENEANLRAIFDNSTEGLMLLDAEGRIKAFNARAAENHTLHNIRNDLEIGKPLLDFIIPDRKAYFTDLISRVMKGESVEYDIDYERKDGGKHWFHAALSPVREDGRITGVCIARSDISERKHAEQKISEAVERYNMVAKATNDSIYDWNLVSGRVIRSGDGLKVMFGYEVDEVNSHADFWKSRVHSEDSEATYSKLHETLKNPELNHCSGEYRFRKADGNYAYVFDKGFIIRNKEGEAVRMIGATQDLTEIKATEQQLKDLLNITRDQNKRLQNFAHIVSHNIRSHSSNIIGLVELLNEQGHELVKNNLFTMLKTSTSKLSETIENLNDIITVQNNTNKEKNKVDLRLEVDKTCDVISVLISQTGTKLDNQIPENTFVNVIPSYLESILLNLLTNAIKYKSPDRDPVITLKSRKIKDYTVVSIEDNGMGIDLEKNRDKLFGMYKTFHNNKDARGFGLFITKNQIEAMNGKIEVESKPGTGTTFKIYIYEKN